MASVYDMEERIEESVKAAHIARAVIPDDVTIIMAQEDAERTEPCFLIGFADGGIPEDEIKLEFPTGNRQGDLTLVIQTHTDYGRDEHRALVAAIRDPLYSSEIFREEINALADGVAIDQFRPTDSVRVKEGNSNVTVLTVEIVVRPVVEAAEEE